MGDLHAAPGFKNSVDPYGASDTVRTAARIWMSIDRVWIPKLQKNKDSRQRRLAPLQMWWRASVPLSGKYPEIANSRDIVTLQSYNKRRKMLPEDYSMRTLKRISFDPRVMGGKPCIRGMRVTVGMIVGMIASGHSREEILELYPYLERQDIDEALEYAAWRAEEIDAPLAQTYQ